MNDTANDRSKFILALLVIAAATALLALGRLDGKEWVSATTWTVAAYMLGQVGAVVAQGWAVQTIAKAKAAGVVGLMLLALSLPAPSHAFTIDGLFADGFEFDASCEAAIDTPVGPRERLLHAAVSYGVYQAQRPNVDLTEWRNLWGHNSTTDLGTPWPGVGGAAPVIRLFPRWGYIAAHFRTPDDAAWMSGHFDNPSYVAGPNVIMAISAKCGDFTQYLPTPGCRADAAFGDAPWTGVPTADKPLVPWKFTPNAPGSQCNLAPGRDYYANLMFADPADPINCPAAFPNCVLGTVSYHN